MDKINFISTGGRDDQGRFQSRSDKKTADVSMKFTPGQKVYFIHESKVLRATVTQVNVSLRIYEDEFYTDIRYILNNEKDRVFRGDEIFARIEEVPIVDVSDNVKMPDSIDKARDKAELEGRDVGPIDAGPLSPEDELEQARRGAMMRSSPPSDHNLPF